MRRVLCSLFVLGSLATAAARADVTYEYTAVPSSNSVQAGNSITVAIYLSETITPITGSSPQFAQNQSLIALDGGLFAGGFFVNTTNGSAATITGLANNVASSANGTNFDTANKINGNSATKFTATQASVLESTNNSTTYAGSGFSQAPVTSGSVTNTVLLGTLTITGGSSAGNTTYAIESFANAKGNLFATGVAATGNTVTGGFGGGPYDLDNTNNAVNGGPPPAYTGAGTSGANGAFEFTINTTAAPEPSSFLLCGLAVFGGAYAAYRRRKPQATVEPMATA